MERETKYNCIRKSIPNFDVLDSHTRFIVILTSHEKEILRNRAQHHVFEGAG